MIAIFDPITIGDLKLRNRIVMGPMTRARAADDGTPTDLMVEYYSQRASAGLVTTEGVYPSVDGKGYFSTPGIETEAQTTAWKKVTDAVHARGGHIFLQMMHCGRVGHSANKPSHADHIAPSAIQAAAPILIPGMTMEPMSLPRALSTDEVVGLLDRFERAAENAKAAGFDGVELHAASGYLPNQFLATNTNQRDDRYGGSSENRIRFVIEAIERIATVFGAHRTSIKLAPGIAYNDIHDEDIDETYGLLLRKLDRMGLAYLSFQTSLNYASLNDGSAVTLSGPKDIDEIDRVYPYAFMRANWSGVLVASGDLTFELASAALQKGAADMFVFGRAYISNPDLRERMEKAVELALPDRMTFYGGDARGYTDYPTS
jgi:N-ethylmaleimide reductase